MKKAILILILANSIIFTINLSGQIDKDRNLFSIPQNDSIIIKPYNFHQSPNNPIQKFNLPDSKIIIPNFDLSNKDFNLKSPELSDPYDNLSSEKFPGSENFYAKRPNPPYTYEKSFVKKPDTTVKYQLIIIDPITQRRIN